MGYNGAVIDIPLTSDVEGFVSNIKSQLGKVKNVGIKVDTKSLEDALDAYLKTFKEISNQKLNTGTFSKAQKEISTEIDSLRRRTEALEEGMASLIDVMSGADGGKFASELSAIKQNMLDLSDATRQTVSAVSQLTGNGNVGDLKSLSKALSDVINAYNADTNTTQKFKSEKAAISAVVKAYEEYNDVYDKIDSLEDSGIDTTAKQKELANLQEQLVKTGKAITELMDVAGEKFGASFHENQDPFGSYFKDIYASIVETTKKIVDTVRTRRNEIEQELKKVQQPSTSQGISATEQSAKIEAKIATTTKGLKTQLQNLLDSVQPYLDENPLEVNVTLASGWGTRKNAELIKQFQAQIDAISEQTDVSQIEKLLNDINKSFGDEISLKFKSNFDEEQKAIRAGIASLKVEVGNKFELNPKISKDAATKLQAQLNELSKKITLKVSEIQLDDSAIQQAVEIKGTPSSDISIQADVLAAIIDAITEKTDFLALGLNSVFETLKDIREILVSYPMDEIVSSSREFVRVLQQAYGIMSKEDLDSMFSNLKKSTENITGKLRGDNLKQLKEILAAYREYQDLGGKNTLSDLGGANNVQQWFKRNKDIILETTDSLNKLDEAEKKVIVDGGETNSLNELSSKLDEVIQKIEEKTNKFREESNLVSQVIPDEITQLGNLEERLKSIKDTCDKLLSTRKVKGISSSLLEAFDQIAEKIKSIGLDQSLGTTENGLGALFGTSAANDFLKVLEKIKAELKEVSDYADGVKISSEISIAPADIERITNAITELRVATEAIQAALSDGTIFKGLGELSPEDAKSIKTVTDALAELANVLPSGDFAQNIDKIRLFVNKFSSDTGVERIEKAAEGVNKLREALDGEVSSNSLLLIFQKISESTDISGLVTELKSLLKIEAAANQAAVAKKEFSEANKMMKESADESSLSLDKEKAAFEKIWNKLDGLNQQKFMPGFNDQIESIRVAMMGIDETADDAAQAYHNLTEEAQKLWKQHGFPEWKKAAETSIASLEAKIAKFGRDNTAIAKEFSDRLDEIRSKIHDGMSIEDVQKLGAEFKRLDADIANAGQGGITFMDTLRKRLMGVNAQLIAQYLSWQDMIRYMRQAVTIIKELDDALVDLKKTTAMSNSDLKEFYYNANGIAKEMGVTTAEIIQQASSWSRLGYNTKETSETMAQLSSQFASISPGMSVEEAQTGLVSIMKAWDVDVSRVERDIMDNINTLGNKFAETNSDIIGGMERAGATFSAIGMSIEDSFALFTGAQEVIQNAETVGTALKTLSLRIRGYDEETEELSEDVVAATGKVADLTKVASNNFAGVSLWADAEQTQYRSLVDYLGDISEIWDEIDAKSQTELLENLFGKRGASVGSAILKNFDQVKNALEAMEQAEGSADREMEIIQESISYKLNNLQQTWVGILQELIDNGMLGELIDALTTISEVLGKIITTAGPIPTLIAGLGLRELVLHLDKVPGGITALAGAFKELLSTAGKSEIYIGETAGAINAVGTAAGTSAALVTGLKFALAGIAVVGAGLLIKKIFDETTVSVEETNKKIAEDEAAVESLNKDIEELKKLDSLTEAQEANLRNLERELKIKERILELDKQSNAEQSFKYGFAELFDADNYMTDYVRNYSRRFGVDENFNETTTPNEEGLRLLTAISTAERYAEIIKDIDLSTDEGIRKYDEYTKKLKDIAGKRSEDLSSIYQEINKLQSALDTAEQTIADADAGKINVSNQAYDNAKMLVEKYRALIAADEELVTRYEILFGLRDGSIPSADKVVNGITDQINSAVDSVMANVKEKMSENFFGDFSGTEVGERIEHLNDLFAKGEITYRQYMEGLQTEFDNFDASAFTNTLEDAMKAEQQFFVDSAQVVSQGLSNLFSNWNEGKIDVNEYLDSYLSLGSMVSTLTDKLQENSAAWSTNGDAISTAESTALDNTQNMLSASMAVIESYQDSIYSLTQINSGAIEVGTQEYRAHLQVIAEDIAGIIQAGGDDADILASRLGTTTAEIAESMYNNVANLGVAEQGIMDNTNTAITNMATAIGNLFDTLGNEISNFRVDLKFTPKIDGKATFNILGKDFEVPTIKFELAASGESLSNIGSAIKTFGASVKNNIGSQLLTLDDFHIDTSNIPEGASKRYGSYVPETAKTNYNNALDNIKALDSAAEKASKAADDAEDSFKQLYDYFERMIKVLDNSIDLLEAHLQDVVGSFAKNTLLSAEENVIRSKMNGYASAIDMYSQKAAEALSKIPSDVAARLQNGAVAIEEFVGEGNEEVYEAIQDYEQWADKVANCKQQIVELREALRQLELQKFNNVAQDFQELFDVRQTQIDLISKAIELFDTARDKIVGRGFYDEAIEQKEKQLSKLFEKRVALNEQMASAMANGVETAGDEWFEMLDAVEEVNSEILEAQKSIEEYKNAIIQLYVDAFDRESDRYTKQIALRQKAIDALEKQISVISSAGNVAGRAYYDEQIKQTAKQIVMLEEERRELESRLNDAIKNGVKVGTSEWYAMVDAINEVDSAIQDANKSIEDYKNSIVQLYMELFNRETDRYSKQVSLRQKSVEALEKQITAIEASGNVVGESFFKEQIEQTEKQIDMLEKERKALMQKMSDATANGVKVGSDEWYEMVDALNNVDSAIQECVASIEEMDNAILELHTETFERIQNRYSSLSSEMSNMADMLSDKDVATADNVWTKEGLSQLGLYAQQYELAKKQVSQFNQEIDELNKQYANGKYSVTEYTTKLAELKEQQWASVKSAKAAKESIIELNKARVDIVVEGIQKEIEAYKELIEAQKDALSSEKELRDYEKSIAESSKSISDLERQLAAMANDDSAAARAKRLKLEAELEEAREDLADKEYEHSISVQQEALAQQAEDFQAARELEIEALQETLEQEKSLLIESFNAVKENAALIAEELILMAQNLNITMSPEITAPWQAGEAAIAAYSELFNVESSAFMTRLGEVEASEWRVQEQANNSSQAISDMFGNRSDELVEQTNVANDTFRAEEEAVLNASAAIAENFSKRADELVSSTDEANAAFRAEEQAAWDASGAIANAFGNRADELVATIENARGSTENLTAMSDALADSLANSIDGSYSGSSATSALGSIADAANDVAEAANNAADALRNMIDAQSSVENNQPKEHVTSIYGGEHAGQVAVWSDRNGNYSFRANGSKRISHDELAWTQEKGSEIIISPSSGAILTPLKAGDAVIPADMTSNLWAWGSFNPQEFAAKLLENSNMNTSGNVQANTMQIGSLITVNGNINDTEEMVMIASNQAANKIKQSFKELSNNLRD